MTRFPTMILVLSKCTGFTAGPNNKWDVVHQASARSNGVPCGSPRGARRPEVAGRRQLARRRPPIYGGPHGACRRAGLAAARRRRRGLVPGKALPFLIQLSLGFSDFLWCLRWLFTAFPRPLPSCTAFPRPPTAPCGTMAFH